MVSPTLAFHTTIRQVLSPISIVSSTTTSTSSLHYYSNLDTTFDTRDAAEQMVGGVKYEMVELPDSMMSTTLWVGNLCEFVTDEMLSELFQQASSLKFVPACVARKANMQSLRYGFVTFRSEEEKETAMNLLHGYEHEGKVLMVESIRDHEIAGRIRVPQKIVDYAVGPVKRQRKGELNTMRRATRIFASDDDDDNDGDGDDARPRWDRGGSRDRMKKKRKKKERCKNKRGKNSRW
eukprot:CAMPEP_0201612332 /NCGR_PEP_ID=MMETSP0492-20130828/22757_1 /ASSEMBLY_ACC=CAM_ASM_000837 /TAXON_ID=420259 /ORGANISM="Thalassiosira gravida, Strain GMp14c1" /LENGTH=235 /DNA_ID=CAMNT_0048078797 /DNA_START=220 /DNA_END=924 /DNA_ORIENTATION=-